ncbi:hypothetical protein E3N88_17373 [Mikania micrantha]|uniref:DUF985 domain-containing protein n=1 Tax=Mikania micrantha TaxID=192012 RepID=A0A5N6NUP6_9ASTR|nr:hypothetical protein E3N88_17373 [Mikania micrantha]
MSPISTVSQVQKYGTSIWANLSRYEDDNNKVLEINDKDGSVKFTCMGQDIIENQLLQYTVPPEVWFGAFPTRDYDILADNRVAKNAPRDAEKHFSLVGTTVAPAFEPDDFVLAKRSQLVSRFPALESLISMFTHSDYFESRFSKGVGLWVAAIAAEAVEGRLDLAHLTGEQQEAIKKVIETCVIQVGAIGRKEKNPGWVRISFGSCESFNQIRLEGCLNKGGCESKKSTAMKAEEGFYDVDEGDYHTIGIIIAACFVLVALLLSSLTILQHLKFYTNPEEQKWIVAVLFMVPVYATESVSGERRVVELLENEKETLLKKPLLDGKDLKPDLNRTSLCKFFRQPRILGEELLQIEKFGLVQYMILKTFCSFLAMVLELLGVYGDGEFKWYYGYPYIAVVMNFSQMWALYCLVKFYQVTHERLKPIRPLAKFISFKAIVFATWWQGVGIALLCYFDVLPKHGRFQTELQDFLICIEMAVAAVAHVFVFSAKPYHFLPVSEYGKISTKTIKEAVKVEEGDVEKPALIEKTETMVEAPGTSVKESMQEIVVEGGQHVVDDVKLTINQAIEPVGKGVTKIQETFHHLSVGDHDKKSELEVDECEQETRSIKPTEKNKQELSKNKTWESSEATIEEYKHE